MASDKKVLHEVSGWLRVYEDGTVDRTWTGPSGVTFLTEAVPPHEDFINGVATRDVVTDEGLRVRIYLPEQATKDSNKLPIILHFHGGGFCISQADWYMYYHTYAPLAHSAQAICVSVYLRHAPEHRLPAACDDGFAGLLWLQSLANGKSNEPWLNSHADFNRVFLIGDSAGANIVHQVAARGGDVNLSPLRLGGGILIHPGFVRSIRSKSELEKPQSPMLTLDMLDKLLEFALPIGSTKDHPITCPMGAEAQPLDSLKLPPLLLCVAENDLMKDTEMEYYEAMARVDKVVELLVSPGMGHCFYLNKIALNNDPLAATENSNLFEEIVNFINKY